MSSRKVRSFTPKRKFKLVKLFGEKLKEETVKVSWSELRKQQQGKQGNNDILCEDDVDDEQCGEDEIGEEEEVVKIYEEIL